MSQENTPSPEIEISSLEPRILLSATWVDAPDDQVEEEKVDGNADTTTGQFEDDDVDAALFDHDDADERTKLKLKGGTVSEDAAGGTLVGRLSVSGMGSPKDVRYAVVDEASNFEVEGDRLLVKDGAKLDFEERSSCELTIRVTDGDGNSLDKTVTIKLTDGEERTGGTKSNDKLHGSPTQDAMLGRAGNGMLRGAGVEHVIRDGEGADLIDGGEGNDWVSYRTSDEGGQVDLATGKSSGGEAAADTIRHVERVIGSQHDDALSGDDQANTLLGSAGNDESSAADGSDLVYVGGTNHVVDVGQGDDRVYVWTGDAKIALGEGDNIVKSLRAGDLAVDAGTGNDRMKTGAGDDQIAGEGDDTINATGELTVARGDGLDIESASFHEIIVRVTNSNGRIFEKTVTVEAEDVDERIIGTELRDDLTGTVQDDVMLGLDGNDTRQGGDGDDQMYGAAGLDNVRGGESTDELRGEAGNDFLPEGNGADLTDGGEGVDWALYQNSSEAIQVLTTGEASGGDAEGDTLRHVEEVMGAQYDDVLMGDDRATYTVTDGNGHTSEAVMTSQVAPVADRPTLEVTDISTPAGETIDLGIVVQTMDVDGSEEARVVIQGLPAEAKASIGTRLPDGGVSLSAEEVSQLRVTLPDDYVGDLPLRVVAISEESDASEVRVVREMQLKVGMLPTQDSTESVPDEEDEETPHASRIDLDSSLRAVEESIRSVLADDEETDPLPEPDGFAEDTEETLAVRPPAPAAAPDLTFEEEIRIPNHPELTDWEEFDFGSVQEIVDDLDNNDDTPRAVATEHQMDLGESDAPSELTDDRNVADSSQASWLWGLIRAYGGVRNANPTDRDK